MALRIADLVRDSDLLPTVQEAATILQEGHAHLIDPLIIIKRWIGTNEKYGHV